MTTRPSGSCSAGSWRATATGWWRPRTAASPSSGFEFMEELRRQESWRGIPVIVLTSKDVTAEDQQRLNGGVERVIQKGAYTRESLLGEVRRLVKASVARRKAAR